MREAVGGSILFYIILGFLAVYIIFIGLIMNYAATYRASNYVITTIEQSEGQDLIKTDICENLRKRKYYNTVTVSCEENDLGPVYTVITNVKFEVPLIGINGNLKIKNETKTIYGTSYGVNCVLEKQTFDCGGR